MLTSFSGVSGYRSAWAWCPTQGRIDLHTLFPSGKPGSRSLYYWRGQQLLSLLGNSLNGCTATPPTCCLARELPHDEIVNCDKARNTDKCHFRARCCEPWYPLINPSLRHAHYEWLAWSNHGDCQFPCALSGIEGSPNHETQSVLSVNTRRVWFEVVLA